MRPRELLARLAGRPWLLGLLGLGLAGLLAGAGRGSQALLLAGLVGAYLVLRRGRARGAAGERAPRLRVLERTRLPDGAGLQLVEADGHRLLVGTGQGGPRLLARLGCGGTPARAGEDEP